MESKRLSVSQTPSKGKAPLRPKEVLLELKNNGPKAMREKFLALRKVHLEEMVKYKQLKRRVSMTSDRVHSEQGHRSRTFAGRKVLPRGK